ncbi:MAG TPA: aldehyde dehydrogenase family protein [Stellaceae bacterium]|jgi:aldehyde dehydrogenase (NAD+)/betaine-aldehyde dehydrogenase|nr:aldehyde dehydrogenase family protein [Stellaceae bacterium]
MQFTADRMLIDGALVASESNEWDDSVNPATEQAIGRSPAATAKDVDRAVAAAQKAAPGWAALHARERAAILRRLGAAMQAKQKELLEVEVTDTGNTITPMRGDVNATVNTIDHMTGLGYELKGETIPASTGNLHYSTRQPFGVVGRIVAFNHPILFLVARSMPALVAGNTMVIKPSETSPLSALAIAEIAKDILPPGVFNIVTGGRTVGDAIVRHPKIKRLSFIGSVPTAMAIQRAAAEVAVKKVTLELGGKNPMIVFPDVDLDEVAEAAVKGMNFTWSGQSCGSLSRLMLHESIYDAVLERVVARVAALKVGDPMRDDTDMGPVNSRVQYEKVQRYVGIAKDDGARLMTGGARPEGAMFERGYWIRPTVFAGVEGHMRIAQEEVFGPILSVLKWSNLDQAIEVANSTQYGLTAAIWTHDIGNALGTAARINSGYQWVNGYSTHFIGTGFGGMGNSGVGREECLEDILSYTETKTVHVILNRKR